MKTRILHTPRILAVLLAAGCLFSADAVAQGAAEDLLQKPEELYSYACGLFSRKMYDMADIEMRRFMERYPKDKRVRDLLLYRIEGLRILGRLEDRQALLEQFRKKYPKDKQNAAMGLLEAEYFYGQKKYSEAAAIYESLMTCEDPVYRESAVFQLANCNFWLERRPEAEKLLKELADKPMDKAFIYRPYALITYAEALEAGGHLEDALRYYQRLNAANDIPGVLLEKSLYRSASILEKTNREKLSLGLLERLIANYPDGAYSRFARTRRVHLYFNAGEYRKAADLAAEWRVRYPDAVDFVMDEVQGCALMKCGLYEEALPFFMRVSEDPASAAQVRLQTSYYAVYCLHSAHHDVEAEQKAQAFLDAYPKSSYVGEVLWLQGDARMTLKQYEKAVDSFRKAMGFFAENAENYERSLEMLVQALDKLERYAEAAKVLRESVANPLVTKPEEYLYRSGLLELKANNIANARLDFRKVAAGKCGRELRIAALEQLMKLYASEKDYPRVLDCLDEMAKGASIEELADIAYNKAAFQMESGNMKEAEKTLQESILTPKLSFEKLLRAQNLLLRLYWESEQNQEALPLQDSLLERRDMLSATYITPDFLEHAADVYAANGMRPKAEQTWHTLLAHEKSTPTQKAMAKIRLAQSMVEGRGHAKEAVKLLDEVGNQLTKTNELPSISRKLIYSLMAEALLESGDYNRATWAADKAQRLEDGDERTCARTLYILAYLRLKVEKRPELANQFATQCFILYTDPDYCPRAMVLSIECFLSLGKTKLAQNTFQELENSYPAWLAENPAVRKIIGNEAK